VRARGFTLVEMLVALVVLGLVMGGVVAALRVGLEGWRRQAAAMEQAGRIETVDRSLRRLVSAASGNFAGDAHLLAFDTMLPMSVPAHLRRARVEILADASGRLAINWTARLVGSEGGAPFKGTVEVLDGVDAISFRYWVQGTESLRGGWVDALPEGAQPLLIRVHFDFDRTGSAEWPDMLLAPRILEGNR
jgi:general secretion pathway protein J